MAATLTTTDIAVAAGLADIGDLAVSICIGNVKTALATIHRMADTAVDRMKTSADRSP